MSAAGSRYMGLISLKHLAHGNPLSTEERFNESYMGEPMSGCWLWLGYERNRDGYGTIRVNGSYMSAHRFSWLLHFGAIPNGALVCHRCDNTACVNPNHLFLGSHQDNMADKVRKGRVSRTGAKNPARGERSGTSKLTAEQVASIRTDTRTLPQIAAIYGLFMNYVWRIKHRKTWRHVT